MPEITINGVPTIPQHDGTRGKLELVNDGRTLRLVCKVDVTDRRLMDIRCGVPVSVAVHRLVGDQQNVLYAGFMRIVRCEHDITTLNEHWLVLECEPVRDRSGAPTIEEEMGL